MASQSPEQLFFDSDLVPAADRFAHYCAFNGPSVVAQQIGPEFAVRVMRWRLDRAALHERHLHDVMHERDAARAADGVDHFVVHLLCSGRYEIDSGAGSAPLDPGEAIVIDMSRPMRSRANRAHVITISFARSMIAQAIGDPAGLHGRKLNRPAGALFADFVVMLACRAATLTGDTAPGATRALLALLSSAVEQTERLEPHAFADLDQARFDRVQWVIEQSLGDPRFGPDAVVARSGLSRATLYRLFQPHGGLRTYIRRRRLDRVRVALSGAEDPRSLAEIAVAAGFQNESHCSRQFLTAFGIRPGEYRARVANAGADGREPRIAYWLSELR